MKNKYYLAPILVALTVLGGCAAPGLYRWGGYDQALYAGYKDTTKLEALRITLEAHVGAMEKSNQKVAPGLYAELGTLYIQSGATDLAISYYKKELVTWPESRTLMTTIIQNIELQQTKRDKKL